MFAWHHIGSFTSGPPTALKYRLMEVARLHERVNGTWFCTLRQHLPYERRVIKDCRSYESGKAGCEEWARRHETEIEATWQESMELSNSRQAFLGSGPVSPVSPTEIVQG